MAGQRVDPYTGKTLPNSRSHFPLGYRIRINL